MQLPVCALLGWSTIVIFSLVPKRLSIFDFAFLYGVTLIITTSTFTTLDIDLHWVTIKRTPAISFSVIISRLVTIPLFIMMAVDSLQYSIHTRPRWAAASSWWIGLTVFSVVLELLNVISYHEPLILYARDISIMNLAFIVLGWGCIMLYRRFDAKNVIPS